MKRLILSLPCLLFLVGPGVASDKAAVMVENTLSECASVNIEEVSEKQGFTIAQADIQLNRSIASCGCFSSLARYQAIVSIAGSPQLVQMGLTNLKKSGRKALVLSTEPGLMGDQQPRLRLSCAPPT